MATNDDRISFRAGNVRHFKLTQYKDRIKKLTGKEPKTTDIMLKALDMFLEFEGGEEIAKIRKYEAIIIKLMIGAERENFKNEKAYIEKLEETIKRFKDTLAD